MIVALALMLSASATTMPADAPDARVVVIAVPRSGVFSGWYFDGCRGGRLVELNSSDDDAYHREHDCLWIGGEVYRTRLDQVQVLKGSDKARLRHVGIVGHALFLPRNNEQKWLLVLRPTTDHEREIIGVDYVTVDYGWFEEMACTAHQLPAPVGEPENQSGADANACHSLRQLRAEYESSEFEENSSP